MKDKYLKLVILWQMLASSFRYWKQGYWGKDLDERACCDGRECGCYGMTIREIHFPKEDEHVRDL